MYYFIYARTQVREMNVSFLLVEQIEEAGVLNRL